MEQVDREDYLIGGYRAGAVEQEPGGQQEALQGKVFRHCTSRRPWKGDQEASRKRLQGKEAAVQERARHWQDGLEASRRRSRGRCPGGDCRGSRLMSAGRGRGPGVCQEPGRKAVSWLVGELLLVISYHILLEDGSLGRGYGGSW